MDFNNEACVKRIEYLCKDKGVTVNKALSECGFKNFIVNLRKGSIPSVDKFFIIADYFGVDIRWLLTGNGTVYAEDYLPSVENYMSKDEKVLLENYRCLSEKEQDEIIGRTTRLVVHKVHNEPTQSQNIQYDGGKQESHEISEELAIPVRTHSF